MSPYPVFLRLEGRTVLVVGAGPVAAEKAKKLASAGARVRTVSPEVSEEYTRLGLAVTREPFDEAHLEGVYFVVAAAPPEVNRRVFEAAERRAIFVLAVDDPAHGSAFGGAVITRGDATVVVGTGGRAPALSGLLREALEELLPVDLAAWVDVASLLRPALAARGLPLAKRREAVLSVLVEKYARQGKGAA
ncbi:MAG: bifunctional precorrin-2 dehydrogenase/sirohydrochlorin ferrochelatase [Polyangiaceae bacterium]